MSGSNTFAIATVGRLPNVLAASGHIAGARRAAEAASSLSRRNVYHARAKLMQAALQRLVELVFEPWDSTTTILANVDIDGKVLVAVPWSRMHHSTYGLRRTDADALRWEMRSRCMPELDHVPLFTYDAGVKRWYLNRHGYPLRDDAMAYLQTFPVTWQALAGYARHLAART